jgi:hypothetical protein
VWALLASDRLQRPRIAAVAGVLVALALLTKETSAVFLCGPIVVVMIRGGRRARPGMVAFWFWTLLIAGPWYVFHAHQLGSTFTTIGGLAPNAGAAPPRGSWADAGWYLWALVNYQVLAVVGIGFLVGFGAALVRWPRLWRTGDARVELIAGVVFSYVGMTLLTHKDARYTLPALVYVAVLAVTWIVELRRPSVRRVLAAVLILNAVVLFCGQSFGLGARIRVGLPGAPRTEIAPWQVTAFEPDAWVRGGPAQDGDVLALLRWMSRTGIHEAALDTGPNTIDFNLDGIRADALAAGVSVVPTRHAPAAGLR